MPPGRYVQTESSAAVRWQWPAWRNTHQWHKTTPQPEDNVNTEANQGTMWGEHKTKQASTLPSHRKIHERRQNNFIAKNQVSYIFSRTHNVDLHRFIYVLWGLLVLVIVLKNVNIDLASLLDERLVLTPKHGLWCLYNLIIMPTRRMTPRIAGSPFGYIPSRSFKLRVMSFKHMEDRE